jgi:hypothetical protein
MEQRIFQPYYVSALKVRVLKIKLIQEYNFIRNFDKGDISMSR